MVEDKELARRNEKTIIVGYGDWIAIIFNEFLHKGDYDQLEEGAKIVAEFLK